MPTAAQQAYSRAQNQAAAARRTAIRLEAEAAVRRRRVEEETPPIQPGIDTTAHRERLQVQMEAGALLKPAPPVPVSSRLRMIEREIQVLERTYHQLKAELDEPLAQPA